MVLPHIRSLCLHTRPRASRQAGRPRRSPPSTAVLMTRCPSLKAHHEPGLKFEEKEKFKKAKKKNNKKMKNRKRTFSFFPGKQKQTCMDSGVRTVISHPTPRTLAPVSGEWVLQAPRGSGPRGALPGCTQRGAGAEPGEPPEEAGRSCEGGPGPARLPARPGP